jgi:hypothetical protein
LFPLTDSERLNEMIEGFILQIENHNPTTHCPSDCTAAQA